MMNAVVDSVPVLSLLRGEVGPVEESGEKTAQLGLSACRFACDNIFQNS